MIPHPPPALGPGSGGPPLPPGDVNLGNILTNQNAALSSGLTNPGEPLSDWVGPGSPEPMGAGGGGAALVYEWARAAWARSGRGEGAAAEGRDRAGIVAGIAALIGQGWGRNGALTGMRIRIRMWIRAGMGRGRAQGGCRAPPAPLPQPEELLQDPAWVGSLEMATPHLAPLGPSHRHLGVLSATAGSRLVAPSPGWGPEPPSAGSCPRTRCFNPVCYRNGAEG